MLRGKTYNMHWARGITVGLMIAVVAGVAAAQTTVRLTNGEWPPYMSQESKEGGMASHLVKEAFALKGITVTYGWFPWKRAFAYAQKGQWDGSVGWIRKPEREVDFLYSDVLFEGNMVFFHLKRFAFDWSTIDHLKGLKIGATLGYGAYGDAFLKAEADQIIDVVRVPTDKQNFGKLLIGRIHIFPIIREVGYNVLHKNFERDQVNLITHHPLPTKQSTYHLLLSKKVKGNRQLLDTFNEGLKELKASGRYREILEGVQKGDYSKKPAIP